MYILTYCTISWTFVFLRMYTTMFALILYQHMCLENVNVNNCLNSTIEHFFFKNDASMKQKAHMPWRPPECYSP